MDFRGIRAQETKNVCQKSETASKIVSEVVNEIVSQFFSEPRR